MHSLQLVFHAAQLQAEEKSAMWPHMHRQADSLVLTLLLQRGCSGRSPACPLCSGHEGPSIRPFPGYRTEEMSDSQTNAG